MTKNKKPRARVCIGFGGALVPSLVLGVAASVTAGAGGSALAQAATHSEKCTAGCAGRVRGSKIDQSATGKLVIGENTERETRADEGTIPFSISVDGEVVDESQRGSSPSDKQVDRQRKTDVDLDAVDIQVKFDGLDHRTLLNVSTFPIRAAYRAGENVEFLATANYPAFIERAEVRLVDLSAPKTDEPIAVLPVSVNGSTNWTMPSGGNGEFGYVLRVYDAKGRFDETEMLFLARSSRGDATAARPAAVSPGMAEDRTAVRNIPVHGGAVTIFGRNVPPGYAIVALGDPIPVDAKQSFVAQRILPPGEHKVAISVTGPSKGGALTFNRDINIPDNEWFYVALADLTVGKRMGDKSIENVRSEAYDRIYTKGGLSFYLKGKIQGRYLLTGAANIEDGDWKDLLRNTVRRDPKKLLKRIDPDQYYPVYGDDSVAVNDAPTDGKLFVRLERGDSHVMWGNYKTHITGTDFLESERSLYGANLLHRSEKVTSSGEHQTEASVYAAQPGTLPQQDEFLATGGSTYFLQRQDIALQSATVAVEVRDSVTGRVLQKRFLDDQRDYTINHLQGLILLKQPLASTAATTGPVRDSALGGGKVFLVVQYEYTPRSTDSDAYSYGGRLQRWLNNTLRFGVTGVSEKHDVETQKALGADFKLRLSSATFVEGEIARASGSGSTSFRSTDGGLSFSDAHDTGSLTKDALAWRLRGQVDLEDLRLAGLQGIVGGGYQEKKAGFSRDYEEVPVDRRAWDAHANFNVTDSVDVALEYKALEDGAGRVRQSADAALSWQINDKLAISSGISHTRLLSPAATAAGKSGYDGSRVDGGVRAEYRPDDDRLVYAFGQGTLDRSGDIHRNDRAGVGGQYQLTEKVGLSGEASYGTEGLGGIAAVDYTPTVEDAYYIGYKLDPDRAYSLENSYTLHGIDKGTIVAGSRRKISEAATAYAESTYDAFGNRNSLAQTYGIEYTPDAVWTVGGAFQTSSLHDETLDTKTGVQRADFERQVASLSARFRDEETLVDGHVRGEARLEDSRDDSRDVNSYFFSTGLGWNTNSDWRLLTSFEGVISDSQNGAFLASDYIEASVGYAYRPVDNDRLNALFKYTFLYDQPGYDQISAVTGTDFGPRQRSHILSADATFDLYPWLSVGAKYGFRIGEIAYGDRGRTDWALSSAHLGIVRADLHLIKDWDFLLEGRALYSPVAQTIDYGTLLALYRHVGNNFKIGAGFNFGRFSDDLQDVTLDDRGLFFNMVGKY
jgi:hypothetical protein